MSRRPPSLQSLLRQAKRLPALSLDALLSEARGLGGRRRSRLPPPVDAAVQRVVSRARSGAKPSVLLGELRAQLRGEALGYLGEHPGRVLAFLRASVPGQPLAALEAPRVQGSPLQAAEAFAGGGLYDLALAVEGIQVNEVCEIDEAAVASLRANLHPMAAATDALAWTPTVPPGGLDLLTGGPPCQPWSQARRVSGGGGVSDAKNMYPRVLEWIADSQPRVVCLENSAELAKNPEYRGYMSWWYRELRELGYEGLLWRLSAADYGTPQLRERAWALAWPAGAPWGRVLRKPPPKTHGRPGTPEVEDGRLLPWTRAFDRLNSGCCAGWGLTTCVSLNNRFTACLTCTDGSNYEPAPNMTAAELRVAMTPARAKSMATWVKGGKRLRTQVHPGVPASVQAAWDQLKTSQRRVTRYLAPSLVKNIGKGWATGLLIPEGLNAWGSVDRHDPGAVKAWTRQLQAMGVRDAAKLQDVPQWYAFQGRRAQQLSQIGNGIPLNMGRAVARQILRAMGFAVPMPGSYVAANTDATFGATTGLWPMDRLDGCVGVDAPLAYEGGLYAALGQGKVPYRAPNAQERRQRPFPTRQTFDQMRERRDYALEARAALAAQATAAQFVPQQQRVGFWRKQGGDERYVHDWSWRPAGPLDPPPGFPDVDYFWQWVYGQDPDVISHYEGIYGRVR